MRSYVIIAIILFVGGCSSWPEHGKGGLAEKYQNYPQEDELYDSNYTQPEDVAYAYEKLSKISPNFIIAASFGNVHGVYKPGNVVLTPMILKHSQAYVSKQFTLEHQPLDFVFHGGSGSDLGDIKEAISYGVVKMNIDTDTQWATWQGVMA